MSWQYEGGAGGVTSLMRTSVPDLASFDHHIQHTLMTEIDIVNFCAYNSYISRADAIAIAGQARTTQQGLLATVPAAPVTANDNFFLQDPVDARSAASRILGFDVDALLGPTVQSEAQEIQLPIDQAPYQWTGCLSDVYAAAEGTYDWDAVRNNDFHIGDISDPRSFEELFGQYAQGGFIQPSGKSPFLYA